MATTKKRRTPKVPRKHIDGTVTVPLAYKIVTGKVIEMLGQGLIPWETPWHSAHGGLPMKLSNRRPYRGINVLILGMEALAKGYRSPWWGTFEHITGLGGNLTGAKHTKVIWWSRYKRWVTNEETGQPEQVDTFNLKYFRVFNADQAQWPDGRPAFMQTDQRPPTVIERHDAAESIIAGYRGSPPVLEGGNRAFYDIKADVIHVPPAEQFKTAEGMYWTIFHELVHSTGSAGRLNRPGIEDFDHFGSDRYAKEELVAALGAAMLAAMVGLSFEPMIRDTTAYVQSWIAQFEKDPKLIVLAASQAQNGLDLILGTKHDSDESTEPETDHAEEGSE